MPLLLGEILLHPTFSPAEPVIRTSARTAAARAVRWVHSSEVLDIAPLLRGGELLLCGGIALATASAEMRSAYVRDLAERGVAALAVETGGVFPEIPRAMLESAEEQGLPIIELRKVVPFVGVMQAINSILVSESVAQLQEADAATHAMAAELAHGATLDQMLAVLAGFIHSAVTLVAPSGATLGGATPAGWEPEEGEAGAAATSGAAPERLHRSIVSVDIPVRGVLMARLELEVADGADANLARVAGSRAVDILGLALLQRMPPGLHEVAGTELMRAIIAGGQAWRLQQLAPAAGFATDSPAVTIVIRSGAPQQLRAVVDKLLNRRGIKNASYVDSTELVALAGLSGDSPRVARSSLLADLTGLPVPAETLIAMGPVASGIAQASWSLAEARRSLELFSTGRFNTGHQARTPAQCAPQANHAGVVIDAEELAVERFTVESVDAAARVAFVGRQLGAVMDHDSQRQSQLLATLAVWLDSGCNTAQSARELHLERQSMHHRLQRVFELCGGDPRGTGRLAALHLATRMARLP